MDTEYDIFSTLRWSEGKRPPQKMRRAVNSVIANNHVFFRPWGDEQIHEYDIECNSWCNYTKCEFVYSSLAYVLNMLTAIGGEYKGACTDKLLSLTWEGDCKWQDILPPMPTKRKNPVSVTVRKRWLVVSGGIQAGEYLTVVEVLNIETKQWTVVDSLPEPIFNASVTFGLGHIYMLGGNREPGHPTTTVLSCSVDELIASEAKDTRVWKKLADLPVERSCCVFACGHLLAIGGQYHRSHATFTLPSASSSIHLSSAVYKYSPLDNTWSITGDLGMPVSECFASVLPGNKLMVLGGNTRQGVTDKVLIGTFEDAMVVTT